MNILMLFAGLVVIAAVLASVVALICVLFFGRKRSRTFRILLGGVCCLPGLIALGLFDRVFGPLDIKDPAGLRGAYQFEFGEEPTEDVTMIQCRQVVVGDAGAAWLSFHAAPETVERLLRKKFVASDAAIFRTAGEGGNCPSWWQPDADGMQQFYKAEGWSKYFRVSEGFLAHDREKQIVYFHHSGFD